MAGYLDEEEIWKCKSHPSKRHRRGVCPNCLKDRLSSLCSDCATARPCSCLATSSTAAASSSSSSSFSMLSRVGSVRRVFNLTESDSVLRRSRSLSIPIFRSKPENRTERNEISGNGRRSAFWSVFRRKRSDGEERDLAAESRIAEEDRRTMMGKSRSVAVTVTSELDGGERKSSAIKSKSWYFPSPIKAFRQSRVSKLASQLRSPLYRG